MSPTNSSRPYHNPYSHTSITIGAGGAGGGGYTSVAPIPTVTGLGKTMTPISEKEHLRWVLGRIGNDHHPALEPKIIGILLELAESVDVEDRLIAAAHRLTPYSRIIMMQDDPADSVRDIVNTVVEYEEKNGE